MGGVMWEREAVRIFWDTYHPIYYLSAVNLMFPSSFAMFSGTAVVEPARPLVSSLVYMQ